MADFPREPLDYPELMTFQDAVERIQIAHGLRGTVTELNAARMAVMDSMRELPAKHSWAYYQRAFQVTSVAPVGSLVGVYDHTGGAVERQLTLTTGTWPATAAEGQVLFSENLFKVEKRISDTVVQLSYDSNPGADVASTQIVWCQTSYRIGQRVRRILSLSEATTELPLDYLPQQQLIEHLRTTPQPSTPIFFNIHQTGNYLGMMEIEFAPPPMDVKTYILAIEAQPRPLRVHSDPFKVNVSGATVTSLDNAFKSYHKGSVLRLGKDADAPTGSAGNISEYNPYVEQRIITNVVSSTTVQVSHAFDSNWSGVGAVITDPLDLDTISLWDFFFAMATRKFAQYSPVPAKMEVLMATERQTYNTAVANNSYVHTNLIGPPTRLAMPEMDFILAFPVTETNP